MDFLKNLYTKFESVEYYVVDAAGTILMLDANGKTTWFVLKHESDMIGLENLAHDQEAPSYLIERIEKRSLIPFFFSEDDYKQPASEWEHFCYAAQPLPCAKNYYYSVFSGADRHILNTKVASYNAYCNPRYESSEDSI